MGARKTNPTTDTVKELARLFDYPIEDLLNDAIAIPGSQDYIEIDRYLPYSIAVLPPERQDSVHILFDADLAGEGILHRFTNPGGVEHSAIYVGSTEVMSQCRERETQMIRYWNEMHTNEN